jgi:transposase
MAQQPGRPLPPHKVQLIRQLRRAKLSFRTTARAAQVSVNSVRRYSSKKAAQLA